MRREMVLRLGRPSLVPEMILNLTFNISWLSVEPFPWNILDKEQTKTAMKTNFHEISLTKTWSFEQIKTAIKTKRGGFFRPA